MTYYELLRRLQELDPDQLELDVTVYVEGDDEYYPVNALIFDTSSDVLGEDHPVIRI